MVGVKKSMSDKCNVEEWMYEMIVKIVRETEKDVWIITVYNNVGFKRIEKDLGQCVEDGVEMGVAIGIEGDWNARIEGGGGARHADKRKRGGLERHEDVTGWIS